jgi:hypothetical protein
MHRKSEKGMLLVFTVVAVFIVSSVVGTLLTLTTAGTAREKARDFKFKSREVAEAALDLSLNALRQATDGQDNDGDGLVDEGLDQPSLFPPGVMATLEGNLGRIGTLNWNQAKDSNGNNVPDFGEGGVVPLDFSGGEVFAYTIFSENDGLDNDGDGVFDEQDEAGSLSVIAQGRYGDYVSQVQYKGIFTELLSPPNPPTWSPQQAFVAGGDLKVSGNVDIYGANGSIHSNKYMDLGGSTHVTGDATSSGGGVVDPANVDGTVDTGAPEIPIPDINATNMKALADQAVADGADVYLLQADGKVVKDGVVLADGTEYHGWKMDASGDWSLSSNAADLDGLFYTPGSVVITGCKTGINMTVLSEGNISISGNGMFNPYYENFFIVSLHDIKLSGTPQETGDVGVILAREQIKASGNVFVRGTIMAADLDNASSFVEDTTLAEDMILDTTITGNFDIEYNGGFSTSLPIYDPNAGKYKLDPTFCAYEER